MGMASPVGVAVSMVDHGRGTVERDAVLFGQDGDVVGADLVGKVAVGGDAVRAYDDGLDAAGTHQAGGHVVADDGGGDAVGHQFPRGKARALQKRPRLVGVDVNALALFDRGADDAERGAVAASGQRAGVAVGEHAAFIRQQRAAECAHGLAGGDVFLVHGVGFGQESLL